jgi:hypothetical protein
MLQQHRHCNVLLAARQIQQQQVACPRSSQMVRLAAATGLVGYLLGLLWLAPRLQAVQRYLMLLLLLLWQLPAVLRAVLQ